MKIKIITIFFVIFINNIIFSNENTINNFINDNDINIGLGFDETSRSVSGVIAFENGTINSYGNGTFSIIIDPQYFVNSNKLEIYFSRSLANNFFDSNRDNFIWTFPERFKIILSYEELVKIQNVWNKYLKVLVDTTQTYPTTCQAIVIDNLNIRDTPSLSGKKIGMLSKASEVTLYEQSKNQEEIDGEKNFWYKVKVDEETYGWVYGAYVRIFFEDPSLGYSDKEKILKSLETL